MRPWKATTSHSSGGEDKVCPCCEAHGAGEGCQELLSTQEELDDAALDNWLCLVDRGALCDDLRDLVGSA